MLIAGLPYLEGQSRMTKLPADRPTVLYHAGDGNRHPSEMSWKQPDIRGGVASLAQN